MKLRLVLAAGLLSLHLLSWRVAAADDLAAVHQDFSTDPGWEGVNNRIVADDPPTKTQDFGWSNTAHSSKTAGEIGGMMWCSRTPAWYGMPLGRPLSFKDPFSASGRICIRRIDGSGYIGFFNSTRQEWRPWSSIAMRLSDSKRGDSLRQAAGPGAQIWIDYMSATWKAGYMVLDHFIPGDASVHAWRFEYDPTARVDTHWPDARLEALFQSQSRMSEDQILNGLQKSQKDMTRQAMRRSLEQARDQGLLDYDPRRSVNYWEAKRDLDKVRGRVSVQLDDEPVVRYFLDPGIADEPTVMDRFGLFNYQIPEGRTVEFYVSDLVLNGQKFDLSRDPNWQGMNNRVTFVERDFHPGQNYGYSQTNWAGKNAGEIGGLFWRNEPIDPHHGFYADEIGALTLDDSISFSGSINFVNGGTDASMQFGYFNREDQFAPAGEKKDGDAKIKVKPQALGIRIADSTSIGYSFQPFLHASRGSVEKRGPQFVPDRRSRHFSFEYDPRANGGIGRIVARLDDSVIEMNLKPDVRKAGARFDRFGLMNVRTGGKYVEVYFDDLTYTARRASGAKPKFYPEKVVKIPYPPRGRKY
jgi:hypothetical protein